MFLDIRHRVMAVVHLPRHDREAGVYPCEVVKPDLAIL